MLRRLIARANKSRYHPAFSVVTQQRNPPNRLHPASLCKSSGLFFGCTSPVMTTVGGRPNTRASLVLRQRAGRSSKSPRQTNAVGHVCLPGRTVRGTTRHFCALTNDRLKKSEFVANPDFPPLTGIVPLLPTKANRLVQEQNSEVIFEGGWRPSSQPAGRLSARRCSFYSSSSTFLSILLFSPPEPLPD